MWDDLEPAWQQAFLQAWQAFLSGSVPIGAVITDEEGSIIARGRNQIHEENPSGGQVYGSVLAHAELNALLHLKNNWQTHSYTLYTTMEPCPLCFGALYMSGVRNLIFAARDRWAGSTDLYNATPYMSKKTLQISGPITALEGVQIALKTYFILNSFPENRSILEYWKQDAPRGVSLGELWYRKKRLRDIQDREGMDRIFDEMVKELDQL